MPIYAVPEAMNKYPTLKISELKKIVGERADERIAKTNIEE